jgi:hypothetical protein
VPDRAVLDAVPPLLTFSTALVLPVDPVALTMVEVVTPPLKTVSRAPLVKNASTELPPDEITRLELPLVPLTALVLEATPPEEIVSWPPNRIVALLSTPPELTISLPPPLTVALSAEPPEETISEPPLLTVALSAEPPEETISVPPLLMTSPLVTPPEVTSTVPPLNTIKLLPVVPDRLVLTPLVTPWLTVIAMLTCLF